MKPILSLLIALFMMPLSLQAQLLWEVTGNDLEKPSYVYGTVHVGDKRAYTFIEGIKPRLQACDIMAGELDLDISLFQNISMMMSLLMPNDTTLKDLLSAEEYAVVKRKMDKKLYGIGMIGMADMMERIKPTFISMFLTALDGMDGGSPLVSNDQPALDMYLQIEARKYKKEVMGLETLDEQIGTFDKIPLKKQAKMLHDELVTDGGAQPAAMLEKMLNLYATGELDSLHALSASEMDEQMLSVLLNTRNHNMANRMHPFLKKGRTMFVAVGAAHLLGEEGVLELLRKKGYVVTAVEL